MTRRKNKEDYLKVGRPETITPEIEAVLFEAFAIGCSDAEAILYAEKRLSTTESPISIANSVFYSHQDRHPEFLDKKKRLKENPTLKARNAVVAHLDDPEFALKYLERKRKAEFSLRIEQTGADGKELGLTIVHNYRDKDGNIIDDNRTNDSL